MNRPEGTVSTKTEMSCKTGTAHNMHIGEEYHVNLNLNTLLIVEKHCKHDTFSVHDYEMAFGTILVRKALLKICTETADSGDPLQECDNSHCLTHSVTLMPELTCSTR